MSDSHIAIVQARMGSTRFPGKILSQVAGKPLLWHIIYRLKQSVCLTDIIIATSKQSENDCLVDFAKEQGVHIIRGSEDNVLERFELAYEQFSPLTVTRICGDSPLIDGFFIDRCIKKIIDSDVDYLEVDSDTCIHEGLTSVSSSCFEKILTFRENAIAKEHVTGIISEYSDLFKSGVVELEDYEKSMSIRLSIDTKKDLVFMNRLYELSGQKPGDLSMKEVTYIIKEHPELLEINQHVHQKNSDEKTQLILIDYDESCFLEMVKQANGYVENFGYGVRFLVTNCNKLDIEQQIEPFGFGAIICNSTADFEAIMSNYNVRYIFSKDKQFLSPLNIGDNFQIKAMSNFFQFEQC